MPFLPQYIPNAITLWPFPYHVFDNLPGSLTNILVAELSMGQMTKDVELGIKGRLPVDFYGRTGGEVFEPSEITKKILSII